MTKLTFHLVSDSTGETLLTISKAVLAQFADVEVEEHLWSLTRTKTQMLKVIHEIKENPGFIMYTVTDPDNRRMLKEAAMELDVPCFSPLARIISSISGYLNISANPQRARQHILDDEYFARVEAINYTLAHDDGQSTHDLDQADIILVGVSRTSKSPTCIYLAYRGFKVANIPFVKDLQLPDNLYNLEEPLIVGLTINPERLIQIRRNRLLTLNEKKHTDYVDYENVIDELESAKAIFKKYNWPIIDVTKRSVEETAATIMQFYKALKK